MTQSQDLLFKILRISLGTDNCINDWCKIDYEELFEISKNLGVVNIVCDGVQKMLLSDSNIKDEIGKVMNESLWYKWIGYGLTAEKKSVAYLKTISEIASFFNDFGYHFYLLKGYGISLYYPIPSHRSIGDIDFYLEKENITDVHESADYLFQKNKKVPVNKSRMEHHSHFVYHGFTIEHHYQFTNTYKKQKRDKEIDTFFKSLIEKDPRKIVLNGIAFRLPSPTFNAIFLMWHMAIHFCESQLSVKQLCDWAMFVKSEKENVNWIYVEKVYKKYGLEKFANVVNNINRRHFNVSIPQIGEETYGNVEEKVIEDVFCKSDRESLPLRILNYPRKAWKYSLLNKSHWSYALLESVLFHTVWRNDTIKENVSVGN